MKVVIIGRTEILYNTAILLKESGFHIAAIITSKEAVEYKSTSDDFKRLATEWNIPFVKTAQIENAHNLLQDLNGIDIAVSINYSGVIPESTMKFFPLGILNAHGGDLPRYRGNACQAWAILNGENKVGLCVHRMIGGELDSGDILKREYMSIDHNTKVGEVLDWIASICPKMFLEVLCSLRSDPKYIFEVQSKDPAKALRCYPRLPEDGRIDWKKSNIELLRLINASNKPYSGAYCYFDNYKMVIWDAELVNDDEVFLASPGQITKIDLEYVEVATGEGKIRLKMIEFQGNLSSPYQFIKSIRKRLY